MKGINRFKKLLQQRGLKYTACFIGVGLILFGVNMKFSAAEKQAKSKIIETKIETADENIDHIARWTSEVGAESQAMLAELEKLKGDLAKSKAELAKTKQGIVSRDAEVSEQLKSFRDDIANSVEDSIQKGLESTKKSPDNAKSSSCKILESSAAFESAGVVEHGSIAGSNVHSQSVNYPVKKKALGFGMVAVSLEDNQNNNIGAGDIVEAVLLGGVVASTATNSSKNPRPVVLELLAGTDSPAKWFFSKQKKCLIIGAAHGSISDERVYLRLETLRCIDRETGKSVETTVNGFVSDESGRAGIRGTVVTRDRQFLMNSVIGGTLAGAANAFSQLSNSSSSYNPFTGNVNQDSSTKNLLKQAGSQGIGSALDRYAKYQIERAQMLDPVIQVSAGRKVDVVFTQGIALGTLGRTPNIRQNNTSRNSAVASASSGNVGEIPELNNANSRGSEMAAEFIADARGN